MKSIFIVYNQAITEEVLEILEHHQIRGFTKWEEVQGQGSETGDPHMGTHTWPALNGALLAVINEELVEPLFNSLRELNNAGKGQGLKAFTWHVENFLDE